MKQRVAVARTLANSPEVMLMDEPFAAVDAQTRMTLQEELVRISERSRVTVIFITHSVEEAIFLGDRVVVMTPGPGRCSRRVDVPFPRARRNWQTHERRSRSSPRCASACSIWCARARRDAMRGAAQVPADARPCVVTRGLLAAYAALRNAG